MALVDSESRFCQENSLLPHLFLRADAGVQVGNGHLMRCMALALEWRDIGGDVTILSNCESYALRQRIVSAGLSMISFDEKYPESYDLEKLLSKLALHGNPWLVIDGYHFDADYQQAIRDHGYRLLVIDDMAHLPKYHANVLLNQNINANQLNYCLDSDTTTLLGTDYALLRSEFLSWKEWVREIPSNARRILVTMGGSDPDNETMKVIEAMGCIDIPDIEIVVVVGQSNPNIEKLRIAIASQVNNISLLSNVTDMPSLMAWADLAVSGAGSTSWELAFMGLPSALLVLAENQRGIANGVHSAGIAVDLGWHSNVSVEQLSDTLKYLLKDSATRQRMSELGRQLVDGLGTGRVAEILTAQCRFENE